VIISWRCTWCRSNWMDFPSLCFGWWEQIIGLQDLWDVLKYEQGWSHHHRAGMRIVCKKLCVLHTHMEVASRICRRYWSAKWRQVIGVKVMWSMWARVFGVLCWSGWDTWNKWVMKQPLIYAMLCGGVDSSWFSIQHGNGMVETLGWRKKIVRDRRSLWES